MKIGSHESCCASCRFEAELAPHFSADEAGIVRLEAKQAPPSISIDVIEAL